MSSEVPKETLEKPGSPSMSIDTESCCISLSDSASNSKAKPIRFIGPMPMEQNKHGNPSETNVCRPELLEIPLESEHSNDLHATKGQPNHEVDSPEMIPTEATGDSFKSPNIAPLRRVNKQKAEHPLDKTGSKLEQENPSTTLGEEKSDFVESTPDIVEKPVSTPKEHVNNTQSPAEQLKHQQIPVPYKEPGWGGLCPHNYCFEVIKNGTVIDSFKLTSQSYYVIGRLPNCDMIMEHPSLSRYHAIVQYCGVPNESYEQGWYLYDLNSTHGTWVNKRKVKPQSYTRLRVGYVVKLGGSTRLNILQGPDVDQDTESELTVTELKQQKERQKIEAEILEKAEDETPETQSDEGCSWGIDSTDPEEIDSVNPFALDAEPQNEELYIDDPKKALRGFFEREGCELPEYTVVEDGYGKFKCCVELPIDNPMGEPIVAEVSVSGKKKEAVAACALEACRIIDRHGELRKAMHESRAKKRKNWEEEDFYASDDDTFLDRTGDIEKKRKLRMKRESKETQKAETYDSLVNKITEIDEEIQEINDKLLQSNAEAAGVEAEGLDAFDAYMASLKSGALDMKTKTQMKRKIFDLKQEKQRLQKLANTAKPALPKFQKYGVS